MHSAGARSMRADEQEAVAEREAVLSAWEQKLLIEDSPLRTRRFERDAERSEEKAEGSVDNVIDLAERRTVTITGQANLPRPRRSAAQQTLVAQPDRIALWAFLLGLFLVVVAAATANASPL
jgi:hypothetical protein